MTLPRFLLVLAAVLLASPVLGQGAELATLRPQVVVEEPTLRLGDIFDGDLVHPEAPLGAAPAPGRRMVLEMPQITALARANGVAWRPLTGQERVIIERPGRPVEKAEVIDLLRPDLLRLGLAPDAEPDLPGFVPPMVPVGAFLQLAAEQVFVDGATNRFTATLVVAADGMTTMRLRLAGRAVLTQPMVVATRRLPLGEVIAAGDVRIVRVPQGRLRPGAAQDLQQVIGQQLRRPAGPEMPITIADLGAPVVVEKNSLVVMTMEAPGLTLITQGRALEPAGQGQVVSVMNLASRNVVEAVATGIGRVRVAFGSAPIREQQLSPTAAVVARQTAR